MPNISSWPRSGGFHTFLLASLCRRLLFCSCAPRSSNHMNPQCRTPTLSLTSTNCHPASCPTFAELLQRPDRAFDFDGPFRRTSHLRMSSFLLSLSLCFKSLLQITNLNHSSESTVTRAVPLPIGLAVCNVAVQAITTTSGWRVAERDH